MDDGFNTYVESLKAAAKAALQDNVKGLPLDSCLRGGNQLRMFAESKRTQEEWQDAYVYFYRLAFYMLHIVSRHPMYKDAGSARSRAEAERIAAEAMDRLSEVKDHLRKQYKPVIRAPAPRPLPALPPTVMSAESDSSPPAAGPTSSGSAAAAALSSHGSARPPPAIPSSHSRIEDGPAAPHGHSHHELAASAFPSAPPAAPSFTRGVTLSSLPQSRDDPGGGCAAACAAYPAVEASPAHVAFDSSAERAPAPTAHENPHGSGAHALGDGGGGGGGHGPTHAYSKSPYAMLTAMLPPQPRLDEAGAGAAPKRSSPVDAAAIDYSAFVVQLRAVVLPQALLSVFARIAQPNTTKPPRGIETCGILAGREVKGRLVVTHLVVPKQRAGPDHCEMTHEDELLDYCLGHGLITVGWIHTHPTQDCFMSSLDQHTHCGYQSMLPEAIAVVLAPCDAKSNYAVFRLTDDPATGSGLELIQRCELRGFHPHDAPFVIYERSSHCEWEPALSVVVHDMR